jgi:cytochrome b
LDGYHLEKVWDPVTRIWHWALALSVTVGWLLGEYRTFSTMQWHFYCGYATAGLVLFRYFWGLVGPQPVRLAALFPSLTSLLRYACTLFTRTPSGVPGHNPFGALSVIAILLALTAQVSTGLFAEDDGLFFEGPLASLISAKIVLKMTSLHHLFAKVVLTLVVLHLSAISFYFVYKRENLISPMLRGWKLVRNKSEIK